MATVGYDPAHFAEHSLPTSFLTLATRGDFRVRDAEQSRHKSIQVLSAYVRGAQTFHGHAGNALL